jgi:hypothetical protein
VTKNCDDSAPSKPGDISDSVFSPCSIRIEAADVFYNATEVSFFNLYFI